MKMSDESSEAGGDHSETVPRVYESVRQRRTRRLEYELKVWIFLAVGILAIFAKIILLMWLMLSNSVQYRRLFDSFRVYNTMTACLGFHKLK